MKLIDEHFLRCKGRYIVQCGVATVAILVAMVVLDTLSHTAIIASLGSTSFIVFVRPRSYASRPYVVIGGYAIGVGVGTLFHAIGQIELETGVIVERYLPITLAAAGVGVAMLLMTATGLRHSPAAGIALGLVLERWSSGTVLFVLIGVVVLVAAKRLMRRWMINLA